MRRVRRFTALVTSLLFAHVLWAGSGFACAMPDMAQGDQPVSIAGTDMFGMDMAGMQMPSTTPQNSDSSPAHHHAPCESPAAPGDCQSMTPCAPLALASTPESPELPQRVPSFVTPLTVLTPPSLASPPESPPPRA
jgi:hypothetical protein